MKPIFDLFVVHQTEEGTLQSVVLHFMPDSLPIQTTPQYRFPVSVLIDSGLANARKAGLNPVRLIFSPYTYVVTSDTQGEYESICFIGASDGIKCLWAAEGHSLDDTSIPSQFQPCVNFEINNTDNEDLDEDFFSG